MHPRILRGGGIDRRCRSGCIKPSDAVAGMAMAVCAGGVIAPLTLQTENLIKCDTED